MRKKKDTFINMVVSLFAITIVAGFSLGFVNELTVGPIEKGKIERKVNALKLVLPEFDNNPVHEVMLIKSEFAKDSVKFTLRLIKTSLLVLQLLVLLKKDLVD